MPTSPSKAARSLREAEIYAVTGITGKVGGAVAQDLLAAGETVRAVVRDGAKGKSWADKGCEVASITKDTKLIGEASRVLLSGRAGAGN